MVTNESLQVGSHNALDAADTSCIVERAHCELPPNPGVAQRFERDIQANGVSVFEEIGQRLGDAINPDNRPFEGMPLDALSERRPAEAHDPKGNASCCRLPCPALDRYPDVGWQLRANAVECERGKQANHAVRRGHRSHDEAMMLGHGAGGKPVVPARDTIEYSLLHQPGELLAVNAAAGSIGSRNDAVLFGQSDDPFAVSLAHV